MSDLNTRCLDAFPGWLRGLSDDVGVLASALESQSGDPALPLAAGINYLFKSLDLIPDGIEDLGFIDDAFIVRVCAARAVAAGSAGDELKRLAGDVELIQEFLGDDFARLEKYVTSLNTIVARGRATQKIAEDDAVRADVVREARSWASGYEAPTFGRDEKNLVKLKSFLATKLPE